MNGAVEENLSFSVREGGRSREAFGYEGREGKRGGGDIKFIFCDRVGTAKEKCALVGGD